MNEISIGIGIIIVFFLGALIWLVLRTMKGRKLTGASLAKVNAAWAHAQSLNDPVRKVMEGDKVLDLALTELGYTGSLGDKLKKAGPRFSDINGVWGAHKLRNELAHQTGAAANDSRANSAMRIFERALNDLR